jgi:hypothetical protein
MKNLASCFGTGLVYSFLRALEWKKALSMIAAMIMFILIMFIFLKYYSTLSQDLPKPTS